MRHDDSKSYLDEAEDELVACRAIFTVCESKANKAIQCYLLAGFQDDFVELEVEADEETTRFVFEISLVPNIGDADENHVAVRLQFQCAICS